MKLKLNITYTHTYIYTTTIIIIMNTNNNTIAPQTDVYKNANIYINNYYATISISTLVSTN